MIIILELINTKSGQNHGFLKVYDTSIKHCSHAVNHWVSWKTTRHLENPLDILSASNY